VDLGGLHRALVWLELALALPVFVALTYVSAPYGRHARTGWGPPVPARLGWMLMESPASIVFAAVYATGANRAQAAPLVLLVLWQIHYLHRGFLYPLWMREGRGVPAAVVLMGVVFHVANAFVNAGWVSHLGEYPASWLADPRFLVGGAIFVAGLVLNVWSDRRLRRLRAPGDSAYRVPRGGAFEWVSCPNYLGEIVEWLGWALATWSLAGLAFAAFTAANLVPRALAHHEWYRERFADYPPERRALIPFVL
jgi:protein-S-isoprenylcysteine O-methyltransferase Ste14